MKVHGEIRAKKDTELIFQPHIHKNLRHPRPGYAVVLHSDDQTCLPIKCYKSTTAILL